MRAADVIITELRYARQIREELQEQVIRHDAVRLDLEGLRKRNADRIGDLELELVSLSDPPARQTSTPAAADQCVDSFSGPANGRQA